MEKNISKLENPIWIWARIRAIRNFKAELNNIESCLFELKEKIEIENRQRKTSNPPLIKLDREAHHNATKSHLEED